MIKGIVLSSGRVEAFRPLTYRTPLALLPLVDRALIEHQLEFFARNGVSLIRLSCSHLANRVERHCGSGGLWGTALTYGYETAPFGAVPALQRMGGSGEGWTIVALDGDCLPDIDLGPALEFHRLQKADATFVCSLRSSPSIGLTLALDGSARVRAVRSNSSPAAAPHLADAGVCILEPEMLELLPRSDGMGLLQACWEASRRVRLNLYGYQTAEPVLRLTGWRSYAKAQMDILEGRLPGVRIPGTQVRRGIWMGDNVDAASGVVLAPPVLIGDGSSLGRSVVVGRGTVVGRHTVIEAGASIERSLILPGTRVERRSSLSDVIMRGSLIIDVQHNTKRSVQAALPPTPRRRWSRAYHVANRVAALLLLLLLLPLFLAVMAGLVVRGRYPLVSRVRRLGAALPALAAGGLRLRVFDLLYLGPLVGERPGTDATFDPPTFLPRFLARLGNLLNVIGGDILLVGNRPMDPEFAFCITEEWERRRFTCQAGFISVLDSFDGRRLSDAERSAREADYAVYRSVRTDLSILCRAVHRGLASRVRHPSDSRR